MPFRNGLPWAGLASGPGAWAVSTQANYALAPWPFAHRVPLVPTLAGVLMLVALGGALLSWRAWRAGRPSADPSTPDQFLAALGVMAGALFALVIALQGAAGLVLR